MITSQHMKEGMSRAYALAVGYKAGMNCAVGFEFDYKVDGSYREVEVLPNNKMSDSGWAIDFQLKATKNITVYEDYITYNLEVDTYNDLIKSDRGIPRILIVMKLPEDNHEWLQVSEDNTILRDCAWYISLVGLKVSENSKTKTIKIPRNQLLTPSKLIELMEEAKKGGLR